MIGCVFGRLLVLREGPRTGSGKRQFWCECECGGQCRLVQGGNLRNGATKSCGCLRRELTAQRSIKHGATKGGAWTAEYGIWNGLKNRVLNPNVDSYGSYGGKGIEVDPQWLSSFEAFLADMGPRPSPQHSIDRIKNDKGYEPGNCRWVTPSEQARNRSSNHLLEHDGRTMCMAAWSEEVGIRIGTLWARIVRSGWTAEEALTIPPGGRR